jgi:hypothetical protein
MTIIKTEWLCFQFLAVTAGQTANLTNQYFRKTKPALLQRYTCILEVVHFHIVPATTLRGASCFVNDL